MLSDIIYNNLLVLMLGITAVVALGVLWAMPAASPRTVKSMRLRRTLHEEGGVERLWSVAQTMRPPSGVPLTEHVQNRLFGEGGQVRIDPDSEKLLMILSGVIGTFIGLVLMLLFLPAALVPVFTLVGALMPRYIVNRHNAQRRKAVLADLPTACQRLQLLVNATRSIPDSFDAAADMGEGALYDELRRAADIMVHSPWGPVMRELDVRNDLSLFSGLAAELEAAARTNEALLPDIFKRLSNDLVFERETFLENHYGRIPQRMSIAMVPFMLVAIVLANVGPMAIKAFSGGATGVPL